jgi:hypothetical protein
MGDERRTAYHVAVSDVCDNSCVFCLNSRYNGKIKDRKPEPPTFEETQENLRQGREQGLTEAWFTIAEPTLGEHVVESVQYAKDIGFEVIGMNSNGRRFGKDGLIERLVNAGLSQLMLSIHGPNDEIHNGLVKRKKAFADVINSLEAIKKLKKTKKLKLTFLVVVNTVNLPYIKEMYELFAKYANPDQGDQISFTCMKTLGFGVDVFGEIGVDYPLIATKWLDAWWSLGAPRSMLLSEIPGCIVVNAVPDDKPIPPIDTPDKRAHAGDALNGGATQDWGSGSDGETDDNYLKRKECMTCALDSVCPGVMEVYIKEHGWAGLDPVREIPQRLIDLAAGHVQTVISPAHTRLVWKLLGAESDQYTNIALEPSELRWSNEQLVIGMKSESSSIAWTMVVRKRSDETPAFIRTEGLDFLYNGGEEPIVKDFTERLHKRLHKMKIEQIGGLMTKYKVPA